MSPSSIHIVSLSLSIYLPISLTRSHDTHFTVTHTHKLACFFVCVCCLFTLPFYAKFPPSGQVCVSLTCLRPRRPHSNFNICLPFFFASKRPRVRPSRSLSLSLSLSLAVRLLFALFDFIAVFISVCQNVCQRRKGVRNE